MRRWTWNQGKQLQLKNEGSTYILQALTILILIQGEDLTEHALSALHNILHMVILVLHDLQVRCIKLPFR